MFLSTFNIGEKTILGPEKKKTLEPPKTTATLGETHPFAHHSKSTILFNSFYVHPRKLTAFDTQNLWFGKSGSCLNMAMFDIYISLHIWGEESRNLIPWKSEKHRDTTESFAILRFFENCSWMFIRCYAEEFQLPDKLFKGVQSFFSWFDSLCTVI